MRSVRKASATGSHLPAQPNQSLAGGLACLLQLVSTEEAIGCRQMARELGMAPTRVNRLLGTLAHLGLARRTSDRKYVAGSGINVLAAMTLRRSRLLACAAPHIEALRADTGLGVALGVLWRRHVCYLYHGPRNRPPLAAVTGGNLFPAEISSIGKVLLAERSAGEVQALYRDRAEDEEPVDVTGLLAELKQVRAQGYAVYEGRSVAVAVGDPAVAGLALMGGARRLGRGVVAKLQVAADAIAQDMES